MAFGCNAVRRDKAAAREFSRRAKYAENCKIEPQKERENIKSDQNSVERMLLIKIAGSV